MMNAHRHGTNARLVALRASIDNINAAIVFILAERFRCTREIGALKALHKLDPVDVGREEASINRQRNLAKEAGLDPDLAEKFLKFIMREAVSSWEEH